MGRRKIETDFVNPDVMIVNASQASRFVMLTSRRIEQLSVEGYITKQDTGKFRLIDVVQGVLRYEREVAKPSTKSAAAAEVQNTRAEEIRLRMDERKGKLLREAQTEAIDILSEVLGSFRSDMVSLPAKFVPDLTQRAKLAKAIDLSFVEASKRARQATPLVADGRGSTRAAAEHRPARVGGKKPGLPTKHRRTGSAKR